MYVCLCNGVTERAVREAVKSGARDLDDLRAMTGCATNCGSCADTALEVARDELKARPLGLLLFPVAA
jgi:bacterioferritin-associated ferredoxin